MEDFRLYDPEKCKQVIEMGKNIIKDALENNYEFVLYLGSGYGGGKRVSENKFIKN